MVLNQNAVAYCSPLTFRDITCRCRRSTGELTAECAGCGVVMRGNVHMCEVAYGFFCDRCCPACTGVVVLTADEERAIEENRAQWPEAKAKVTRQAVAAARRPRPTPGVRCSPFDIVIRREHGVEFQSTSRRFVLWHLIPEGEDGITVEKLLSRSPFSFPILRQTIRMLLRVRAIEVQRQPR